MIVARIIGIIAIGIASSAASQVSVVGPHYQSEEVAGLGEGLHQAFGYVTIDHETRRVFTMWRAASAHGVIGAGQIRMRRYEKDGAQPLAERDANGAYSIIAVPPLGRDYRDPSPCVDPVTKDLIVLFNDTPTSGLGATYIRRMVSANGGETFSDPNSPEAVVFTIPYAYARIYGGLRYQISTDTNLRGELITTAYYQTGPKSYMLDYLVSRDGGKTFLNSRALGEAPITTDPTNETAIVGVNRRLWFAFSREGDRIWMTMSTDGRKHWTNRVKIPATATGTHVAPDALLVKNQCGAPEILIAVSDRSADKLEITSVAAADLLQGGVSSILPPINTFDTRNAYPSMIDIGEGRLLVTFTREYPKSNVASFNMGMIDYGEIVSRVPCSGKT